MKYLQDKKVFLIPILMICYMAVHVFFIINIPIYDAKKSDTLFSLDDGFFFDRIFSSNEIIWDTTVSRHPLLAYLSNILFNLSELFIYIIGIFGFEDTFNKRYSFIVLIQSFVVSLNVVYLLKYLIEVVKLNPKISFLLSMIFAFSMTNIIFSTTIENFAYSGLFLMLLIYISHTKKNIVAEVILAVSVIGVTVTNGLVWLVNLVIQNYKEKSKIFKTILYSGVLFIVLMFSLPYGTEFLLRFFSTSMSLNEGFSVRYEGLELVKTVIYFLFITPLFGSSTEIWEDGLYFVNDSMYLTLAVGLFWIGLLIYSIRLCFRNKLAYIFIFIILFNVILHGINQFGLDVGFLYSPHHLFAQVILVGFGLSQLKLKDKYILMILGCILLIQMYSNFNVLVDIYTFGLGLASK